MAVKQISELDKNPNLTGDTEFICSPYYKSSLKDMIKAVNNIVIPVGFIYTQYPKEKTPLALFGFGTWQDISSHYAGLFPRIAGGNAEAFEKTLSCTASGTTVVLPSGHGVTTASLLIDPNTWEQREVTAVSGNNITISSAFSSSVTNVLIIQRATLPNVSGYVSHRPTMQINASGAFKADTYYYEYNALSTAQYGAYLTNGNQVALFSLAYANKFYGDNAEVRTNNMSIKVWKRVS